MEWSDHLEHMAVEVDRIERQAGTDDISVKTYPNKTRVELVYHHDNVGGDESDS